MVTKFLKIYIQNFSVMLGDNSEGDYIKGGLNKGNVSIKICPETLLFFFC